MNFIILFLLASFSMAHVPDTFISIGELCPDMDIQMSYATIENFTGEVVDGYKSNKAFLARDPAQALCLVQGDAKKRGLTLKIYDSYRPVKAVAFFRTWALKPETNPEIKLRYYPEFSRQELFDQGYIAKQSSHSRGAAVDLSLVDLKTGKELDMGSAFDYFNDLSHTDSPRVSGDQRKNRLVLKELMEARGFKNFEQEWWHYSYKPEPFPTQYFDFDVE